MCLTLIPPTRTASRKRSENKLSVSFTKGASAVKKIFAFGLAVAFALAAAGCSQTLSVPPASPLPTASPTPIPTSVPTPSPSPTPSPTPRPTPAAPTQSLSVSSDPPGAEVYVDHYLIGTTPLIAQVTLERHDVMLSLHGYVYYEEVIDVGDQAEQMNVTMQPTDSAVPTPMPPSKINYTLAEPWRSAYINFLSNLPALPDDYGHEFLLRDMDGDGIAELIIVQWSGDGSKITFVYSYADGKVYEAGYFLGEKLASQFCFSTDPAYPGLLTYNNGGGQEYYGYLYLENNELVCEDVWHEDHAITMRDYYLTSDTRLINESIKMFDGDGLYVLDSYLVNADGIAQAFGK